MSKPAVPFVVAVALGLALTGCVVAPPAREPMPVPAPAASPPPMYFYPERGQDAARQDRDRSECYRWAVGQGGFDPAPAAAGRSTDATRRADYVRAQTACLEGRGYTVRQRPRLHVGVRGARD